MTSVSGLFFHDSRFLTTELTMAGGGWHVLDIEFHIGITPACLAL